jgi:hypothetical protein
MPARDVLIAEDDLATGKFLHPDDGFQQRRFADAIAADQGNGATLDNVHVDIPEHLALAIRRTDLIELEKRRHLRAPSSGS